MSAAIKASALPIVINLLGIFGVAYQIGNFKGEIAAKVAALEAQLATQPATQPAEPNA